MKSGMKEVMKDKETSYWDYWNIRWRSESVESDSVAGRQGATVVTEVASLHLQKPSVIEIACATGWVAELMKGLFGSYLGLDISPKSIEVAAEKRIPGAQFVAADFLSWNLPSTRFDLALFVDSLTTFRDQQVAVAKVFELLAAGGYLILTSINPFVYSRRSTVAPVAEGQVRKWLSRTELRTLLERNGFRVLKFYTIAPEGDRGILSVVNSPRLNRLARLLIPEALIKRAKERCGLGGHFVVVAQRPK